MSCSRTAPRATSEASVCKMKDASGPVLGMIRRGADIRADLSWLKASMADGGSEEGKGTVVLVRLVRGAAMWAKNSMNRR